MIQMNSKMNKEIINNQKLIQTFMGLDVIERLIPYHSSLDELIPVITKIGDIIINTMEGDNLNTAEKIFENIDYWLMTNDVKSIYTAVIKFIKWKNKL